MSWVLLYDEEQKYGALGCNTSDCVYGPLMYGDKDKIERFADSLPKDPRLIPDNELMTMWSNFSNEEG